MSFNLIYWSKDFLCGKDFLEGSISEKMKKNMEKLTFFQAARTGFRKYRTGGYGQLGSIGLKAGSMV